MYDSFTTSFPVTEPEQVPHTGGDELGCMPQPGIMPKHRHPGLQSCEHICGSADGIVQRYHLHGGSVPHNVELNRSVSQQHS